MTGDDGSLTECAFRYATVKRQQLITGARTLVPAVAREARGSHLWVRRREPEMPGSLGRVIR